jgi:DDE superfamily endonuclease
VVLREALCEEVLLLCERTAVSDIELQIASVAETANSLSVLPAITTEGIIYSHIKEGSYNGDQFLVWLEGLLQRMNPYPAPRSVLVIDNCRIHHVEGVEEMCQER